MYANGQGQSATAAAGRPIAGPPVFAAPSIGLRPFIEQAFAREHVMIDFAGFSGETLHGAVQEPLDKIREETGRAGRHPRPRQDPPLTPEGRGRDREDHRQALGQACLVRWQARGRDS